MAVRRCQRIDESPTRESGIARYRHSAGQIAAAWRTDRLLLVKAVAAEFEHPAIASVLGCELKNA